MRSTRRARGRQKAKRRAITGGVLLAAAAIVLAQHLPSLVAEPTLPGVTDSPLYDTESSIRFEHSRHADTACSVCHSAAVTSNRAGDRLTPPMQVCAECHTGKAKPALEACSSCHLSYPVESKTPVRNAREWRAVRPAPMPSYRSEAKVRFPHASHVGADSAASCTTCHALRGGEPTMPSMASCLSCHDGKTAPDQCTTCHVTDPTTERLKTSWAREPGGKRVLKPDNHRVDWVKRHGAIAKSNGVECSSCHREADCASCHTESLQKPWQVHPPNYTTMHAIDARSSGRGDCTDCHTVDSFCTSCHVRSGVTMIAGGSPPPRATYHPAGWNDPGMPNNHGVMARRDITECASCHVENDCVSCHTGINPHPPEFRLDCGRWLRANARPCTKCHTSLEELRAICP